ncbi:hypothetical protein KY310_01205 [Candidatus Woesearchaeota archaeon]|nr:hypothetical protein [Candidatus Woesearchaeota archaeon]
MERKAITLMQILDDELKHHPPGYTYRNYSVHIDYLTAAKERYPPLINLIINNPGARKGSSRPRFPAKDQDETFRVVLEISNPPFLGSDAFDQFLRAQGFTAPEQDTETHFPYYGQGRLCKGSARGELTLVNYDRIFTRFVEMYDMCGWERLSKKLDWLHKIFQRVYSGEQPRRPRPKPRKLF